MQGKHLSKKMSVKTLAKINSAQTGKESSWRVIAIVAALIAALLGNANSDFQRKQKESHVSNAKMTRK